MTDLQFTPNSELHLNLKKLVLSERKILVVILDHLAEVYKRRMYAEMGYSSLFKYCTQGLGYSESAALRRINALKITQELPELKKKIKSGHLSLSTLSMAQNFFQKSKKLSSSIINNPTLALNLNPQPTTVSIIKTQPLHSKIDKLDFLKSLEHKTSHEVQKEFIKIAPEVANLKDQHKLVTENLTELRLTIPNLLLEKLNRLKQLRPDLQNTSALINWMADENLKTLNKNMVKKSKKISIAESNPIIKTANNGNSLADKNILAPAMLLDSNTLGAHFHTTEAEVIKKAENNNKEILESKFKVQETNKTKLNTSAPICSFVSVDGHRCNETYGLEIDHIQPKAKGGKNSAINLRWLCKSHNQLEAIQHFGQKQMDFYLN